MNYKYHLQKYNGPKSRHTCPKCGDKHCFTLYVDTEGHILDERVGRCDHESSCGYHYTPSEYFRDHSWKSDIRPAYSRHNAATIPRIMPAPPCTIPDEYVIRSLRYDLRSHLLQWMSTFIDPLIIEGLIEEYALGITRSGDIIYYQIDRDFRCRTGKIMKYDPATGHRIKDPTAPGKVNWVHSILKQRKLLPADWTLSQCLFGEHLLSRYPDNKVMLVESEKTALIACAFMPQFNWLATGGKSNLGGDRLDVLRDREVIAFPDLDAVEHWTQKLSAYPNIRISTLIRDAAANGTLPSNADIADWIISYRQSGNAIPVSPEIDGTDETPVTAPAVAFLTAKCPELRLLIDELGLEVLSESRPI